MGGREKSKEDDLRAVQAALHEKPSKRTLLQRLVQKLAKTPSATRELEALAKAKGIEALAEEATRLGLIPEADPADDPKSLANIFAREYMGEPMPGIPVVADPRVPKDKIVGISTPPADDSYALKTTKILKDYEDSLFSSLPAAPYFSGLAEMSKSESAFFGAAASSASPDFMQLVDRWRFGIIDCRQFEMLIRNTAAVARMGFHEWSLLSSLGLGSQLSTLDVTEAKQKAAIGEAVEPVLKGLLDTWVDALMNTKMHREVLLDFPGYLKESLKNIDIPVLKPEHFAMTLTPTLEASERVVISYKPRAGGPVVSMERRISHYAMADRGVKTPFASPPPKPPTGPPEKMGDDDFAKVFQAWTSDDD